MVYECQTQSNTYPRGAAQRLKIVVLGYVVRGPLGGLAWHHLQYVLGLKNLGHDVLFIEDSEDYPVCYDPSTHQVGENPSYGIRFAEQAFARLGLGEAWAYFDAHRSSWLGPASGSAVDYCSEADLLLNVSGVNPLRAWTENIATRVYIDTDPVFTQVKNLTDATIQERIQTHTDFFSFGELIEAGQSGVPDDGIRWRSTRQPVVMEAWPLTKADGSRYTTVMQWDSYPVVEHDGLRYGMKRESFPMIETLPQRVTSPLEIALGSGSAPRATIEAAGWLLQDPLAVTLDPWTYQDYLQRSRGEVSVAKEGYVSTRSGWFSERSACYLASGRPVVVQDTGFSQIFPVGAGLHAFNTQDEAVEAILRIESNHAAECRAAHEIAEEFFNAYHVLTKLIESLGNST